MKKILTIVSAPLVLTAVLLILKYALFAQISLFWAFSPLWLSAVSAMLVFYGVWLNIAVQRWLLVHGRKRCKNCIHCSLADIRPGRKLCIRTMKEVNPSEKGCGEWEQAVRPPIG